LANVLPQIDPELVQRRLYGKSYVWLLQKESQSTR
jgi:hypothetical protein